MPLPPPQPTYSPAPTIEPTSEQPVEDVKSKVSREKYEEHNFLLTTDSLGRAILETPKMFGFLEYLKITTTFPLRIVVKDALDQDDIIYNNNVRIREKAFIRTRTQDGNGRYLNDTTQIMLNNPLIIELTGSRNQEVQLKIAVTKP